MEEPIKLGPTGTANGIRRFVGEQLAYLTFDIDCLDPTIAPSIGAPEIGGFTSREAHFFGGSEFQ